MNGDTGKQPTQLSGESEAASIAQGGGEAAPAEATQPTSKSAGENEAAPAEATQPTQEKPGEIAGKKRGRPRKNSAPASMISTEGTKQALPAATNPEVGKTVYASPPPKDTPPAGAVVALVARRPKTGKPGRLKLTRFDKDAVKLIQAGTQNAGRIAALLGVDATEVRKRFLALEKKGFVAFDASSPEKVSLTISGYNHFRLSPQKEEEKNEVRAQAIGRQSHAQPQQPLQQQPRQQFAQPPPASQPPERMPTGSLDLAELIRRGAPRSGFFVRSRQQGRQAGEQTVEEKQLDVDTSELLKKTIRDYEGGKCELCRGEFKLALQGGHPKYGHCFCGAAYHEDCYESLLDGTRACARCGRSMEIILDKQSEEAVKAIRKLFE